jgi:hypothetical protein
VHDYQGLGKAGGDKSFGDSRHLIAEDSGENQPAATPDGSGNPRRRLDQDIAEEVCQDNVKSFADAKREDVALRNSYR